MTLARTVSDVLQKHVVYELEGIDRLYLNLYVPPLQREAGCASFFRHHRGCPLPSSALMAPMTRSFVRAIEDFAKCEGIDLIRFKKGQRKDDVAQKYLSKFSGKEGVLFIGKAQEKATVVRTVRRRNPETGATYLDLQRTTALVNHYYFYCVDQDFGPFFIKFCSYFPYNGKVCLNGHEYLKRQLDQQVVGYEALDNGLLSCEDPDQAQLICEQLDASRIRQLIRKWLGRLPHPFTIEDQQAGYLHDISILQAEFSLTQVLDRPVNGRIFFEQVIRDNLNIGRPDRVQLIFNRRITKRTPSRFRTRIITAEVTPSLYIDYKHSSIKQYHKLGRALRTETTINNTRDFDIGKRLKNLSALRKVGFSANRRLLNVQRISHDTSIGEDAFTRLQQPVRADRQRAAGLRFADPRVLLLLSALLLFRLLPRGFTNADLRHHVSALMGISAEEITPGRMTYDLRRLRLHGLIRRIPHSRRYQVTDFGFRSALFLTRSYNRLLRPGISALVCNQPTAPVPVRQAMDKVETAIEKAWEYQQIAM